MRLHPLPNHEPDPASPSLTVLIAAHNEEDRIHTCLRRVLSQQYGNMRVTVVNDRSHDRTAERVRGIMAREPRVNLVEVHTLPEGWIGKSHALAVAAAETKSDYLLFMDCDCRLVPGAIAAVMNKVVGEKIEFLSLWPRLDLQSASERLLTPAATWLLGLWALFRAKRGAANSQVEMGNGQFMLFSQDAYNRVGGHASVRDELAEDLMLAQKVAAMDLPRWAGLGQGLYVTSRDNDHWRTFNSLTRVLIGSLVEPWRILSSTQLLMGGIISPFLFLPLGLYYAATQDWAGAWALASVSAVQIVVMVHVLTRLFKMTLEESPSILSFVGGSAICLCLLVWAWLVVTGWGCVRWGKTAYRVRGSRIVDVLPETSGPIATR
jgi:glycosyltransferase involved in cell wall biosynthesis